MNTSGRITEKIKRLGCPAANKKEGKKSDSTYTIGTHSEDPISFTLFFAIKKVKSITSGIYSDDYIFDYHSMRKSGIGIYYFSKKVKINQQYEDNWET